MPYHRGRPRRARDKERDGMHDDPLEALPAESVHFEIDPKALPKSDSRDCEASSASSANRVRSRP